MKPFQKSILEIAKYLSIRKIARIAGASIPTVEKWITGKNEPHPFMQDAILNDLKRNLKS